MSGSSDEQMACGVAASVCSPTGARIGSPQGVRAAEGRSSGVSAATTEATAAGLSADGARDASLGDGDAAGG